MTRRHQFVTVLLLPIAQLCGGCGLLWVPAIETVPSPVRQVAVLDDATKAPIPGAQVVCRIIAVDTKTNLFDKSDSHLWGSSGSCVGSWAPPRPGV